MIEQLKKSFKDKYNTKPQILKSPARINLIGEHVDYCNGLVMPAAINKNLYFAFAKNNSKNITVRSENYDNHFSFSLDNMSGTLDGNWGIYIHAILDLLLEERHKIEGFDCIMLGDIPIGAGLSSSAALCCGFLSVLNELMNLKISNFEIALIAQNAEVCIGLNCGLMDQYAVLFGKKNKFIQLDCQNLTHQYLELDLGNYELVLIDSKIEHDLKADSFYNQKRMACEDAVDRIAKKYPKVSSLRDVDNNILSSSINDLSLEAYSSANYVINENKRVKEVANAIINKDLKTIGKKLFETHDGLSNTFGVSTKEMDYLVELAQKEPTILGARMMGGGFGGCTLNLIESDKKEQVLERIQEKHFKKTKIQAEIYYIAIENGIEIIKE